MGNHISGMRALRVVLVAAAAIGCFGAEVFSLDGQGTAPTPAPASGGGSATFQPLTDEIARAKKAEATLGTRIDSEIARAKKAEATLGTRIDRIGQTLGSTGSTRSTGKASTGSNVGDRDDFEITQDRQDRQASELKALTAKVLQMETKVAGLTSGQKPASTPRAL